MRLPDPARSRALLLGASRFDDAGLPSLPAVSNNLVDLAAFLRSDSGTGLPEEHCVVLEDEMVDRAVVGEWLHRLAEQAEDLLLVYYSGHGLVGADGELYLALPRTSVERDLVPWTAIPFRLLSRTLGGAKADNRILILDCCFSGRAIDVMGDTASTVAGQFQISGTCTLASSPANQPSLAPSNARYTAYTGELLRVLRNGLPEPTEFLTLQAIHDHLQRELPRQGFPRPEQRNTRTVAHLALARQPHSLELSTDTTAMNHLGRLLHERGELAEAERWYRAAADTGDSDAMDCLGWLQYQRGEMAEAERWYRGAAEGGNGHAMNELGVLLQQRGELAEAERWYRAAADTGNGPGMSNLGWILQQRGEPAEAEHWYRAAADTGNGPGMSNLAEILEVRGELAEAERWYRAAADTGNGIAMNNLGELLQRRGELAEAEHWYRAAADTGDGQAMSNLGALLQQRGELTEAEHWYRAAIDTSTRNDH